MSLHLDELIQLVSCPLPNLMELQLADLNAQLTHAEQRRWNVLRASNGGKTAFGVRPWRRHATCRQEEEERGWRGEFRPPVEDEQVLRRTALQPAIFSD